MKWIIRPSAEAQLWEITAWGDANRPSARVRIEEAFIATIDAILRHPRLGYVDEGTNARRKRMRGTPYDMYYDVIEAEHHRFRPAKTPVEP